MTNRQKIAVLIPVYNHGDAIGPTLQNAIGYGYPVMLVDDGSDEACKAVLCSLAEQFRQQVSLLRLDENRGKGGAIKAGFRQLRQLGYSHAIQVDADGQHELSDLPKFVAASQRDPEAVIAGYPVFDNSVPRLRYYCRYLTHVWVWINTLSLQIRDSMCGFRVYPLDPIINLLDDETCSDRMAFDTEVLVRWCWRGQAITNLPTRVNYPLDGISHFRRWLDNWLISIMHSRLFFGMLYRLPKLLKRRVYG